MDLHRITPTLFETYDHLPGGKFLGTSSEDYSAGPSGFVDETEPVVCVNFPRFGNGSKRQSDFKVLVRWEDMEKMLLKFCEVRHPKALAVQDAINLATAAKDLGWKSPQSN